jgi:hypothetical protein
MYYLNYLIKNAKNKEKLEKDFSEIIKTQEPILHQEGWNLHNMNRKTEIQNITQRHALSLKSIPSQIIHYPCKISPLNPNSQSQNLMIMITVVLVFKIIWLYSGLTERVSTSEQTQLKFSPCFSLITSSLCC